MSAKCSCSLCSLSLHGQGVCSTEHLLNESTEYLHITIWFATVNDLVCYCDMTKINRNTVHLAHIMHCSRYSAEFIMIARK